MSAFLREDLALWLMPGIGVVTFKRLMNYFPQRSEIFKAHERELQACGCNEQLIKMLRQPPWAEVDHILQWATAKPQLHHIISLFDMTYSNLLKEISHPPLFLLIKGNVNLLSSSQLAIVGSRHASLEGRLQAQEFAQALALEGWTIVSGLALGIDTAAHEGALKAGGHTIAVMGTGIDLVYPRTQQYLAEHIVAANGALISEFPLGSKAHATYFPRRNRIISGLSRGVLVVEAALKSGSLITAHYANEQGREVFAIPGMIHEHNRAGCHYLIQQGAKLVTGIRDILEELVI